VVVLRIARIVERLPPHLGGKEVHAMELTRALTELGVQQDVFFRAGEPPPRVRAVCLPGGCVEDTRVQLLTFCAAAARSIARTHRSAPFDAVHAHGDFPEAIAAAFVARQLDIPSFLSVHGGLSRTPWHDQLRVAAFSAMERVLAVSVGLADELRAVGVSSEIVVRPSAVRNQFFEVDQDHRQPNGLIVVGRLAPVKGLETIFRAYDALGADASALRWEFIGDGTGPYADQIRAEIARRPGMECRVEHSPERLAAAIASASALILASIDLTAQREGTPTAALEALAAGTPVIASDASGVAAITDADGAVRVFPAGDAHQLARAVLERSQLRPPRRDAVDDWRKAAEQVASCYRAGITSFKRTGVVFSVPWLEVGGAEHLVLSLASASAAAGNRTGVSGAPGSLYPAVQAPLELVPTTWSSPIKSTVTNALRLAGAFARIRPAAVNSHHLLTGLSARLGARLAGVRARHVLTVHGTEARRNEAVIGMLAPLLFDRVLPVSDLLRRDLVRFSLPRRRDRFQVAHAGIDPPPEPATRRKTVGVVARLVGRKGHRVLLEAWDEVMRDASSEGWQLVIVGDGPLKAEIAADVRRRNLQASVQLRGAVPQASAIIGEFEIVALPSLREGLPLVLIEAMAAGCAVVATAVPGSRELAGGGAPMLVPPGDAAALARALLDLMGDAERRATLAEAGRRRFSSAFTRRRMLSDYSSALGVQLGVPGE
jgi:glycosyltransferase involved in cell wall biosynthesis